ncbi:hypothetical protein LTR66_006629 [Elasticomyces elasticus]|nr:hypothetical protein LTR66_006629 [Elasticomyces elasticus]
MVLLTGGQVSMAISSAIVFIFTSALFFSGYVLQQRSVKGIQDAIKPRLPPPPPPSTPPTPLASSMSSSRLFGGAPGSKGHAAYQHYISHQQPRVTVDWNRLAYVQLVKSHDEVCNAIMLFGELHRLKSPARRVLLFPQSWALEKQAKKGEYADPYLDTSRRLLRMAARRYRVELRPAEPFVDGGGLELPASYSLASVFRLVDYERALVLATPGLVLDATPLDALLAFSPPSSFAALQTSPEAGDAWSDLLLLSPSTELYSSLSEVITKHPSSDLELLRGAFRESPTIGPPQSGHHLVSSISTLHEAEAGFNASAYLTSSAYIRFSDPKLPGPEYDVPYYDRVRARPRNKDADWVWTKLYGNFAQKRMDICGLDLEPWREGMEDGLR